MSFALRLANLFEANYIACQMNSIEYGVMLDLNLKSYTFLYTLYSLHNPIVLLSGLGYAHANLLPTNPSGFLY